MYDLPLKYTTPLYYDESLSIFEISLEEVPRSNAFKMVDPRTKGLWISVQKSHIQSSVRKQLLLPRFKGDHRTAFRDVHNLIF